MTITYEDLIDDACDAVQRASDKLSTYVSSKNIEQARDELIFAAGQLQKALEISVL